MKRIAIHSVPRSGSTWLGSIFDSNPNIVYRYQPLFSYTFKGYLKETSSKKEIINFFTQLEKNKDEFLDQKEAKRKGIIPVFKKEKPTAIVYKEVRYNNIIKNILEKDEEIKIIGLIRNPLAVLSSWYKAPREFRKDLGWEFKNEWRFAQSKNQNRPEEFYGFEKWKETAQLFNDLKEKYPRNFFLVNYEELLKNTEKTVKAIFDFTELNFSEQTKNFIIKSKSKTINNEYSVFKKKNDDTDWENTLSSEIVEEVIKELRNQELEKYLTSYMLSVFNEQAKKDNSFLIKQNRESY